MKATAGAHRRISKQRLIENGYFYLFLGPWIVGFLSFQLGPILASLGLTFAKWEIISAPKLVGLDNWRHVFGDALFWQALKVTTLYTAGAVPLGLASSLLLALLLNNNVRGMAFFRTLCYLPSVTAGVAVALLWVWIFTPDFGLLNYLLSIVGIHGPRWLFDARWVLPAFIIMSIWGVGGSMLIYLSGLQSIPTLLYEAAAIDGANWWHKFRHVTIPMLTPVIFFNLIMGVIGSFQVFTSSYLMTNGGPGYASLFYVLYLYRCAFQFFKMGYAATLAWILLLIIGCLTLVLFKTSGWVYYEASTSGGR